MQESYWLESVEAQPYPRLNQNIRVNTAVIGGGLFGIGTALKLKEKGIPAIVLEANRIGYGASGHTTAKVTLQHGPIYQDILKGFGIEAAMRYARLNQVAIEEIKRIINQYDIDCDYEETVSMIFARNVEEIDTLHKEHEAMQKLEIPCSLRAGHYNHLYEEALAVHHQGMFHPMKFLIGMADILNVQDIFEGTRIISIEKKEKGYRLQTEQGHEVFAENVVIATKYPILNKSGLLFTKLYVQRSYIVAVETDRDFSGQMLISSGPPIRSIRPYKQFLLIGGESHQTGEHQETKTCYRALIDYARGLDSKARFKYRWSTQDCLTLDGLPYIDHLKNEYSGVYVGTGFSKWGMTRSLIAAEQISEQILGKPSEHDLFSIDRPLTTDSFKKLLYQGADVAKDYLTKLFRLDVEDIKRLKPHEGRTAEINGKVIGIYKNDQGYLQGVAPTCPHMGCRVTFNQAERSWDCPCHGSRFHTDGTIIEAPAVKPLEKITIGENNE